MEKYITKDWDTYDKYSEYDFVDELEREWSEIEREESETKWWLDLPWWLETEWWLNLENGTSPETGRTRNN